MAAIEISKRKSFNGSDEITILNDTKEKATLGCKIAVYKNEKEKDNWKIVGVFKDGKIASINVFKCERGRLMENYVKYKGINGQKSKWGNTTPVVNIIDDSPEVIKFVNEIIRKYN